LFQKGGFVPLLVENTNDDLVEEDEVCEPLVPDDMTMEDFGEWMAIDGDLQTHAKPAEGDISEKVLGARTVKADVYSEKQTDESTEVKPHPMKK